MVLDIQSEQRKLERKTRKVYSKTLDPKISYLRNIYNIQKCDSNPSHRNIEWSLSLEQWIELVQQKCSICGSEPILKEGKMHKKVGQQVPINGIDRIDSSKGYIIGNVRTSCSKCNYMKHRMTDDEFFNQIKKIWSNNFANIRF